MIFNMLDIEPPSEPDWYIKLMEDAGVTPGDEPREALHSALHDDFCKDCGRTRRPWWQ